MHWFITGWLCRPVDCCDAIAHTEMERAKRTRFRMLAPLIESIGGCSDKNEAQEENSKQGEIGLPPEQNDKMAERPKVKRSTANLTRRSTSTEEWVRG